jgi:hypothetical protein
MMKAGEKTQHKLAGIWQDQKPTPVRAGEQARRRATSIASKADSLSGTISTSFFGMIRATIWGKLFSN